MSSESTLIRELSTDEQPPIASAPSPDVGAEAPPPDLHQQECVADQQESHPEGSRVHDASAPDTTEPVCENGNAPLYSGDSPSQPARGSLLFYASLGLIGIGILQLPFAIAHFRQREQQAMTQPSVVTSGPSVVQSVSVSASVAQQAPVPAVSIVQMLDDAGVSDAPSEATPNAMFRVALLPSSAYQVVRTRVGKRSCEQAFVAHGVKPVQAKALVTSPQFSKNLSKCAPAHRLTFALEQTSHDIVAFEHERAPGQLMIAHAKSLKEKLETTHEPEDDKELDGGLSDAKPSGLSAEAFSFEHWQSEISILPVTHKRHAVGFRIGLDIHETVKRVGLDRSIVEWLDDALSSRAELATLKKGTEIRLVADATYVGGLFDRFDELLAVEVIKKKGVPSLRLFHQREGKVHFWYDGKGVQPLRSKWRMPLAMARVTSKFNPRRLHPILKTIMPHNGCDFGAKAGTPVYAIGPGVIQFLGNAGPSGNLITIRHEDGIESGYAHLQRFAPGITNGMHIEQRALIGYVGSTGRSTGPHLHLSAKKNGVFIDPLSLKMDATRVLPRGARTQFAKKKNEAELMLDSIKIPDDIAHEEDEKEVIDDAQNFDE